MPRVSHSHFRRQMENHFDEYGLDLAVRKRKQAYNIYWECDNEPLARLRPTGKGDEVEVFWWDDDRWQPAGEFGLALPLEKALQYVTDDPDDLFFREDPDDDDFEFDNDELFVPREQFAETARIFRLHLSACSIFGAATGGMFAGLPQALLAGLTAGFLSCAILSLWGTRGRGLLPVFYLSLITGVAACVGSLTGSAVHGALSGTFWPLMCGAAVGALCNWLLWRGGFGAWTAGFLGGLNLAVSLAGMWHLGGHFGGYLFAALLATLSGGLCRLVVAFVLRPIRISELIDAERVVLDFKDSTPARERD